MEIPNLKTTHPNKSGKYTKFAGKEIREYSDNNEPLEFELNVENARIKEGNYIWERFTEFLPFEIKPEYSLGEGNTPLLEAPEQLKKITGINNLLFKNETTNPTWSFKDRGSLATVAMAKTLGEDATATISTGNMGQSIAAYGARSGIKPFIFLPENINEEKLKAIGIYNPNIVKVKGKFNDERKKVSEIVKENNLRMISGNSPIRIEGYKFIAFEMLEQMNGKIPDYIAVPTSATGNIRGIFKGYRELLAAGYIDKLPKMIVVQAENNSPIAGAIDQGLDEIIPFENPNTIAKAITSGKPAGGNEILKYAKDYDWLGGTATEQEILDGQKILAENGYFVQPASATIVHALRKLKESGKIETNGTVVAILTGSGMKDMNILEKHKNGNISNLNVDEIDEYLKN